MSFVMKVLIPLALLWSLSVRANECDQDAKKFCPGVLPGKGQLALCLSDYLDQLSAGCRSEMRAYKAKTASKNPCYEDLSEYCSDLPSDPENYALCLLKNEHRLRPSCQTDFKKKKTKLISKNFCAQDITLHCYPELKLPVGAVNKCLIQKQASLSLPCQGQLQAKINKMRKKNPCFDDTEKFCPKAVKFIDIQDCLSKKIPTLTLQCKKLVEKENEKLKANPCYRDLMTHCRPGLKPSDQDYCLTLNEEHLSHTCKQFRAVESGKKKKMVKACEADRLKWCKNVPNKDGTVLKCLKKNKAQISLTCKTFIQ